MTRPAPPFAPDIEGNEARAGSISRTEDIDTDRPLPAVSLLFASGCRPNMRTVAELAREDTRFSVALEPRIERTDLPHWMELLVDGLTFDLVGLAPGPPAAAPPQAHSYGLEENFPATRLEAVTLQVGPHLAGGARMLPAVQSLAWFAAQLVSLAKVEAVAWHPARSWSAPDSFRDAVFGWLGGGPFPACSLIALVPAPDGGLHSEGLALFRGWDLRLEPELVGDRAAGEVVARAIVAWMMEHAPPDRPDESIVIEGMRLRLERSVNGRFVRVWKE